MEADPKIKKLAAKVYDNLFHESDELSENGVSSRFSYFHVEVRDRLSEKVRYGLRLVTSPTVEDWRLFPLPGYLSFLHYLLRPMRLAVGLGFALLRRHLVK